MDILKVFLAGIVSTLFVQQAQSEERRFIFDIKNQSLSQALRRFSRMTGIQMAYISKAAQDIKAPSLMGIYTPRDALMIMLRGLHLNYIFINKNTVIIKSDLQLDDDELANLGIATDIEEMEIIEQDHYENATGAERYKYLEEIITTGHLTKHPGFKSSSPVVSLHNRYFSRQGDLTNDEILNVLPQVIPHATPNTNNTGANDGSSTVNLRHLGVNRTLVLFNGRRLPGANMDGFTDISMLPASIIDRIDIVTGGASAIYGSGAIAGVVNFIHDDDLSGLEIRSQFGLSEFGDGEQITFSLAYGTGFAGGQGKTSFYADYDRRGSFTEFDRPISRNRTLVSNGKIVEAGTGIIPGGRYNFRGDSKVVPSSAINPDLLPWFLENFSVQDNGDININRQIRFSQDGKPLPFNFDEHNLILSNFIFLQNPYHRTSLFNFTEYQLTDDLMFFSEISYLYSQQERQLSPISLRNLRISENHPAITPEFAELITLLEGDDTDNHIEIQTRIPEGGPRIHDNQRHYGRIVAGLEGDLSDDWNFTAYVNYGRLRRTRDMLNGYSRLKIQSALGCPVGPNDDDFIPDDCALTPSFTDGISINPFGEGNITPEEINFLQAEPLTSHFKTDQFTSAITLDGQADNILNDQPVLLSVGLEYRYEKASKEVDPRLETGEIRGFNRDASFEGSYDVWEIFGEVGIPLLVDQPLFHKLDYTGGVRLSHYSSAGGVVAWRSGLSWEFSENLRFRGEFQHAVRAPSIDQLNRKSAQNFPDFRDPCANSTGETALFCNRLGVPDVKEIGAGQRQVSSFLEGNANLKEEASNTFTIGAVWQPFFIPNLVITLDYYDITVDGIISPPSTSDVANLCLDSRDINSLHCLAISRDDMGVVTRINRQFDNLTKAVRSGIDLDLNYGFNLEDLGFSQNSGVIDMRFMGGWMISSKHQISKNAPLIDCAGFVDDAICGRALPEFKSVFWISYKKSAFQTMLRWRWLSGVTDGVLLANPDADAVIPHVPAFHYFDLLGSYNILNDATLSGGVRNVFNKHPPLIESEIGAGTDPATYDTRGRYFFIGIKKTF